MNNARTTTPGIANGGLEGCESQLFKDCSVLPGYLTAPISATGHMRKRLAAIVLRHCCI